MSQQKLPLQLNDTEENISIDTILKTIPLALDVEDKIVQKLALFYFPYSVGFEIETITENIRIFDEIPYLIENKSSISELRFRIPNGIKGIQCLFNISIYLKKYAELNPDSGIHYHIDCTDVYDLFNTDFIDKYSDYILTELDKWEYKGTYNPRKCIFSENRNWVRFKKSYKTMEIRIGEMTFDYELLFERIRHSSEIVKTLKDKLLVPVVTMYDDKGEYLPVSVKLTQVQSKVPSVLLSKWINANCAEKLLTLIDKANTIEKIDLDKDERSKWFFTQNDNSIYGLHLVKTKYNGKKFRTVMIDSGIGMQSVIKIINTLGIDIDCSYDKVFNKMKKINLKGVLV